jgi:hypothetical protein
MLDVSEEHTMTTIVITDQANQETSRRRRQVELGQHILPKRRAASERTALQPSIVCSSYYAPFTLRVRKTASTEVHTFGKILNRFICDFHEVLLVNRQFILRLLLLFLLLSVIFVRKYHVIS